MATTTTADLKKGLREEEQGPSSASSFSHSAGGLAKDSPLGICGHRSFLILLGIVIGAILTMATNFMGNCLDMAGNYLGGAGLKPAFETGDGGNGQEHQGHMMGESHFMNTEEDISETLFSDEKWTGTRTLFAEAGYKMHWRVETSASTGVEELILGLELKNSFPGRSIGWMGFGIGEFSSGSMLGADVVTVRMSPESDTPIIDDRYVGFSAYPISPFPNLDDCQDWQLVSHTKNLLKWGVIIKRPLDTTDSVHDRVIPKNGLTRIIWSWKVGESEISYHGPNRLAGVIDFSTQDIPSPKLPSDAEEVIKVTIDNYRIPNEQVSHYVCQGFDLGEKERHVVMIEPAIKKGHEHLVHHFLLHSCEDNYPYNPIHLAGKPPSLCLHTPIGTSPLGLKGCTTLVFAWSGGGSLVLPEGTGFRVGGNNGGYRHLILEIHYNNPGLVEGLLDDSGVNLYATKDASSRAVDATVLVVGDSQLSLPSLQPGVISHREVTCLSACTERFSQPLNVFASFLHAHTHGQQLWTMRYPKDPKGSLRKGKTPKNGILGNHISFWSFGFQQITQMNYTINPGDQLSVHGVFDLTKTEEVVNFGEESSEEMLFDFIFVYPKSALQGIFFCGRQYPDISDCGRIQEKKLTVPNPIPDGMTSLPEAFASETKGDAKCKNPNASTK